MPGEVMERGVSTVNEEEVVATEEIQEFHWGVADPGPGQRPKGATTPWNAKAFIQVRIGADNSASVTNGWRYEPTVGSDWIEMQSDGKPVVFLFINSVPKDIREILRFTSWGGFTARFGPGPDVQLLLEFIRLLRDRFESTGEVWPDKLVQRIDEEGWRELLREATETVLGLKERKAETLPRMGSFGI